VLLLAICMGGIAVSLRRLAWMTAGAVLGIGLGAAVSVLPYMDVISRASTWNDAPRHSLSLIVIRWNFMKTIELQRAFMP
jgi:hypothetical protein